MYICTYISFSRYASDINEWVWPVVIVNKLLGKGTVANLCDAYMYTVYTCVTTHFPKMISQGSGQSHEAICDWG